MWVAEEEFVWAGVHVMCVAGEEFVWAGVYVMCVVNNGVEPVVCHRPDSDVKKWHFLTSPSLV